jgi:hypothetical protein
LSDVSQASGTWSNFQTPRKRLVRVDVDVIIEIRTKCLTDSTAKPACLFAPTITREIGTTQVLYTSNRFIGTVRERAGGGKMHLEYCCGQREDTLRCIFGYLVLKWTELTEGHV